MVGLASRRCLNPFRAPKSLPILTSSNIVPIRVSGSEDEYGDKNLEKTKASHRPRNQFIAYSDSTIAPSQERQRFSLTSVSWLLDTGKDVERNVSSCIFLCAKDY